MRTTLFFFFILLLFFKPAHVFSELKTNGSDEVIDSISFNFLQYLDLSDLEYDDSPYPGRTNMGHVFIPNINVNAGLMELKAGGWYRHRYVHYDEDDAPDRLYPYLALVFYPWENFNIVLGNFENLFPFPNTIYNEFLFFEERPVCSGLKLNYLGESLKFSAYMDWIETDTEEHPEEFITGLILSHALSKYFYYEIYNHYHHKGGQLNKDTHPVRLEQDVATSPLAGIKAGGFFIELQYFWSIFEQNFKSSIYGHAGDVNTGYNITDRFKLSYLCWYNYNYYHSDAHMFFLKRKNLLHRIRADYNIFKYRDIADLYFTVNLYGSEPPGIDFRLYGKIDLDLVTYENND